MTPAQIRIVRASFARIEPVLPLLAQRFYDRLFTLVPDLRPRMDADMSAQVVEFTRVISALVNLHLRSTLSMPAVGGRTAIPALVELGRNHAAMGLRAEHLQPMSVALRDVLRAELGADFTREAEDAWRAAFDVLGHAMQEGMTPGEAAAPDRFLDRLQTVIPARAAPALHQFFQ